MSKLRSPLAAAVSILLCAATLPVNGGLPKRHPAIAGYFLFQQDIPAKTVVLKGQGSTPANPSAGWYKLFVDNTGALKLLDSAGGVTTFGAGGGGFELQTETSFVNNGNPAIYLTGPAASSTDFALFASSDLDLMFGVSATGRTSSVDFEALNGSYLVGNNNNLTFGLGTGYGDILRYYRTGGFEVVSAQVSNSGVPKSFLAFTDAKNHSGITASTEYKAFWSSGAPTYTWATGALTNNRFFHLTAPTMAFDGASTVTNAATLAISGAPAAGTNATITNPYAFWVESGLSRFDGRINAVNADASNPNIQAQNDTGTALRGISLSSYGGYLTSRSSIALNASQTGTLSGNTTAATALVKREHVLSGFTSTGPVLQVEQATGTGNLLSLVNAGGTAAAFDQNGVLLIGSAASPGTNTKLQLGTPTTTNNNVNLYLEPTATTVTALAIQGNSSQTADLFQVFNSAGTKTFFVQPNGVPAGAPSGAATNTSYGYQASLSQTGGAYVTAIGYRALGGHAGGNYNTVVGSNTGYNVTSGDYNVIIGAEACLNETTLGSSVIVGSNAFQVSAAGYTGSGALLVVGRGAGTDLTNQSNTAVFGSATSPLNDWYFGESYSTSTPSDITFQPSVGSGTNIAGSSFYLKGGAGTGNATPGKLYLQYASAGSSGATVQSYTTAVTIDSTATDVTGLLRVDRIAGTTAAPSISAGAAAGTTPTVSITGTDLAGEIVITTGTGSVGSGTLATITLNTAFANDCYPVLQAADADSRGVAVSITHSSTGFTIVAGATGWATSTEYRWTYIVAGG